MASILARIRHRNLRRSGDQTAGPLPTRQPVENRHETSTLLATTSNPSGEERKNLDSLQDDEDVQRKQKFVLWPRRFSGIGFFVAAALLGIILVLTASTAIPVYLKISGKFLRKFYRNHLRTLPTNTFTYECNHNYLRNETRARLVAPYEDKHQVKDLLKSILRAEGRETLIKIASTLAVYDQSNISLFTRDVMRSLPQPYLIKPTHMTGGTALVSNQSYECFKGCKFNDHQRISPLQNGYEPAIQNMKYSLTRQFGEFGPHYRYMPPRVIIEEQLPLHGLREFQWFTVNGHPVFARCRCYTGSYKNNSYFTEGFVELPGLHQPMLYALGKGLCEKFDKPKAFSQMMDAVRVLGRHFPGIVRIDLYVNDFDVYFSEITFTTAACNIYFKPVVADRLLYALLHGDVEAGKVTPDFVERLINDTPWFLVTLNQNGPLLTYDNVRAFSSILNLCNETDASATCLDTSQGAQTFPLRCILVDDKDITALGQEKVPVTAALIRGLEMPAVLAIAFVLIMLVYLGLGGKPRSRVRNNAYFLLAVTVYNYLKRNCRSLTSPLSLFTVVIQRCFSAFVMVHPLENRVLALAHYATYWMAIAAWRARTPRRMLFWWLMYEVVALGANEFFHDLEEYGEIQCARMSFLHSMEYYAVDETIHEYILPPLFVYGYYLPKQLLCWLALVDCGPRELSFDKLYSKY